MTSSAAVAAIAANSIVLRLAPVIAARRGSQRVFQSWQGHAAALAIAVEAPLICRTIVVVGIVAVIVVIAKVFS